MQCPHSPQLNLIHVEGCKEWDERLKGTVCHHLLLGLLPANHHLALYRKRTVNGMDLSLAGDVAWVTSKGQVTNRV